MHRHLLFSMAHLNEFLFLCSSLSFDSHAEYREKLIQSIRNSGFEWTKVAELANQHFLVPALYVSYRGKDLLDLLEPELKNYLEEIHRLNIVRNRKIKEQVLDIANRLNSIEVEPIVLKGCSYLFPPLSGSTNDSSLEQSGRRMIGDIDLLLPRERISESVALLADSGYRPIDGIWEMTEGSHHAPPLGHNDFIAAVELHADIGLLPSLRYLQTEQAEARASCVPEETARVKRLSPTDQVLHNIIHSQIQDRNAYRANVPLRTLDDFCTLCTSYSDELDWKALTDSAPSLFGKFAINSYLGLAQHFLGLQLPNQNIASPTATKIAVSLGKMAYRAPRLTLLYNMILGAFAVLSRDMIIVRYHCKENFLSINYCRLKHILHLATLVLQPKHVTSMSRSGPVNLAEKQIR